MLVFDPSLGCLNGDWAVPQTDEVIGAGAHVQFPAFEGKFKAFAQEIAANPGPEL